MEHSDDGTTWRAVDPAAVQARVVAPLGQQGAELIGVSRKRVGESRIERPGW